MQARAVPKLLGIIARRGSYPILLAESARKHGVRAIFAVAFKGETRPDIEKRADTTFWVRAGQLEKLVSVLQSNGVKETVMAGQITPTNLFTVRLDERARMLLRNLPVKNAETIFRAVADELAASGIELLPAHTFMESYMPVAGVLSRRAATEPEMADIGLGLKVARALSGLDVGQTVVVKAGVVLAVEAFEGTDETILRAGRLAGRGAVIVKTAKHCHDMRFDIPVLGLDTLKAIRLARAAALAFEAGRCIMLDREEFLREADRLQLAVIAVNPE